MTVFAMASAPAIALQTPDDAATVTDSVPTDAPVQTTMDCVTDLLNQVINNGAAQGIVRANASLTVSSKDMKTILNACSQNFGPAPIDFETTMEQGVVIQFGPADATGAFGISLAPIAP
jgi:hypothetical protein